MGAGLQSPLEGAHPSLLLYRKAQNGFGFGNKWPAVCATTRKKVRTTSGGPGEEGRRRGWIRMTGPSGWHLTTSRGAGRGAVPPCHRAGLDGSKQGTCGPSPRACCAAKGGGPTATETGHVSGRCSSACCGCVLWPRSASVRDGETADCAAEGENVLKRVGIAPDCLCTTLAETEISRIARCPC